MKNILILITFFSLLLVSCIPSLHPIYTDKTKTADDRILGTWSNAVSEKGRYISENIQLEVDSNGQKQTLNSEEIMNTLFDDATSFWTFDRAVNIKYTKTTDSSNSNVSFSNRSASEVSKGLIKNGYTRIITDTLDHYILNYKEVDGEKITEETVTVNLTKIGKHTYIDFSPYTEYKEANFFSFNYILAHTFAKVEFENGGLIIRPFNSEYIEDLIKQKRVRLKHELVDGQVILTASTNELRSFIEKYGNDSELYLEGDLLTTI